MPPKKEESTGTSHNEETLTTSSFEPTDSKSNPSPSTPKRSSLKSSITPADDGAQPSTSTKPPAKFKEPSTVTKESHEDPSLSPTKSENFADRSKSIRQADAQREKTPFLTMQMVDFQRRELFLQITLKDIIFYVIFLITLSIMVLGAFNSSMYYLTNTLTEVFITQQFYNKRNIPINFKEILRFEEFFDYCDDVLANAFHTDLANDTENANLYRFTKENRLIGVPRLRHIQVNRGSCTLGYNLKDLGCYGVYSRENELTSMIYDPVFHGPENRLQLVEEVQLGLGFFTSIFILNRWLYNSQNQLKSLPYKAKFWSYGGGGFIQNLGNNADDIRNISEMLRSHAWLYRGSRVVFLDFVVYNVNLNLFCIAKLVFEVPLTGSLLTSYSFTTVKLIRYLTKWDYFVRAAEWLCIGFLIYYTLEEFREIWYFRVLYLVQFWNYVDIALVCLGYICIAYAIALSYEVDYTFRKNSNVTSDYANFEYVAKLQDDLNNVLAILLFLAYIKVFKYLSFNKTFGQLNNTLQRCALDILAFSVMFFVVFIAYSELGYSLFGTQVPGFETFCTAIITLLRTILGDFDYAAMKNVHGVLAPIYFFSFIFIVFFVLLNMFLAIINDTYSEVKVELAVAPEEIQMSQFIKRGCYRFFEKLGCKGFVSKTAKARNEYLITIEEIRGALKRSGFTDIEIRIFFNRYHIDPSVEDVNSNINALLSQLDDSSLKSSTFDFQETELITIDDFLLQEEKLHELEDTIISITEKVDMLLQKLDTIDSVRKSRTPKQS